MTPYPISELTGSMPSHPGLRFTAYTEIGWRATVVAFADLVPCGWLRWVIADVDDDAGMIAWIEVLPASRRMGIATALLRASEAYAEHYGWPRPQHSEERTPEGEAWATSLGAPPARVVREAEQP